MTNTDPLANAIQVKEVEMNLNYQKLAEIHYLNGLNDYLTVQIIEVKLFTIELTAEAIKSQIYTS